MRMIMMMAMIMIMVVIMVRTMMMFIILNFQYGETVIVIIASAGIAHNENYYNRKIKKIVIAIKQLIYIN